MGNNGTRIPSLEVLSFSKDIILKSDQPNRLNFNEGPNLVEILFKLFLQMFDLLNEIEKIPYGSTS